MEEMVAVEYESLPIAASPIAASLTPAVRRERFARYAAGQAVAAFRYRVPLEEIGVGADGGGGAVALWPVVGPADTYFWGRIVLCLAGREAVAACDRAEDAPAEAPRDAYWDYAPLPKADDAHADVAEAWRIIPALEAAQRERWNALYRRARREAFALFEHAANRAALRVLAGHLAWREAMTGMEAAAIIGGVIARTPSERTSARSAPPPARHLSDTDRFPHTTLQ
jgi:hypothetical protein